MSYLKVLTPHCARTLRAGLAGCLTYPTPRADAGRAASRFILIMLVLTWWRLASSAPCCRSDPAIRERRFLPRFSVTGIRFGPGHLQFIFRRFLGALVGTAFGLRPVLFDFVLGLSIDLRSYGGGAVIALLLVGAPVPPPTFQLSTVRFMSDVNKP